MSTVSTITVAVLIAVTRIIVFVVTCTVCLRSRALREEERVAWQRLIRVISHEINNSLTPITSIAGSLRTRIDKHGEVTSQTDDLRRGLQARVLAGLQRRRWR